MLKTSFAPNRKGVAPLEMILALPVIAFLFVLILYVAVSCMQKYELDSLCRIQAWDKRYQESPKKQQISQNLKAAQQSTPPPWRFQLTKIDSGEVHYSGDGSKVETGLFFDHHWNYQSITSQHRILASTWDYRDVDMNKGNIFTRLNPVPLKLSEGTDVRVVDILSMNVQFLKGGINMKDVERILLNIKDSLFDCTFEEEKEPELSKEDKEFIANLAKGIMEDGISDIILQISETAYDANCRIIAIDEKIVKAIEKFYKRHEYAQELIVEIKKTIDKIKKKRPDPIGSGTPETLEYLLVALKELRDTERDTGKLKDLRDKYEGYLKNKLPACRKDLSDCRNDLLRCRSDLSACRDALLRCRNDLSGTLTSLKNVLATLRNYRQSLVDGTYVGSETNLIDTETLAIFIARIDEHIEKINGANGEIKRTEAEIDKINETIKKIDGKEGEIEKINESIKIIDGEIGKIDGVTQEIKDEIDTIDTLLSEIGPAISAIETVNREIDKYLPEKEKRLGEIEKEIEKLFEKIKKCDDDRIKFGTPRKVLMISCWCQQKGPKGLEEFHSRYRKKDMENYSAEELKKAPSPPPRELISNNRCNNPASLCARCYDESRNQKSTKEHTCCVACRVKPKVNCGVCGIPGEDKCKTCSACPVCPSCMKIKFPNKVEVEKDDLLAPFKEFEKRSCSCCMECVAIKAVAGILNNVHGWTLPAVDDRNTIAVDYDDPVDKEYREKYLVKAQAVLAAFAEKCNEIVQQIAEIYGTEDIDSDEFLKKEYDHVLYLLDELEKRIAELEEIKVYVEGLLNRVNSAIDKAQKIIDKAKTILDREETVISNADEAIANAKKVLNDVNLESIQQGTNDFLDNVDVNQVRIDANRLIDTAKGVIKDAQDALAEIKRKIEELLTPPPPDDSDDDTSQTYLRWDTGLLRFAGRTSWHLSYGGPT